MWLPKNSRSTTYGRLPKEQAGNEETEDVWGMNRMQVLDHLRQQAEAKKLPQQPADYQKQPGGAPRNNCHERTLCSFQIASQ